MKPIVISSVVALAAVLATAGPADAVPTQVSFAGRLADDAGPVDGRVDLRFRLYDGAAQVWEESHAGVDVADGLVFVALGSVEPLDAAVFTGAALQIEVAVDGAAMSPRLPILAVPYAARAGDADLLGGLPADAFAPVDHDHDGTYLPVGSALACSGGQKVTGISATGNVTCGADADTTYTAAATGGLVASGNAFSIANNGVTSARIADGAVGSADLAGGAVTSSKIANGNVTRDHLGSSAVDSSKIANDSVTRADLNGAEVLIYRFDSSCDPSIAGQLTTGNTACPSRVCNTSPPTWRICGSTSCTTSLQNCPNIPVGYLLSPTGS